VFGACSGVHFLSTHPYERFPALSNGKVAGILASIAAQAALAQGQTPRLEPALTCRAGQTIRELQTLLIQSTTGLVVVLGANGSIVGVITLHDLLRAEFRKAESAE
jgi:CBS domain-containing protein